MSGAAGGSSSVLTEQQFRDALDEYEVIKVLDGLELWNSGREAREGAAKNHRGFTAEELWKFYLAFKGFSDRPPTSGTRAQLVTALASTRRAIRDLNRVGIDTSMLDAVLASLSQALAVAPKPRRGPKPRSGRLEFVWLWASLARKRAGRPLDNVGFLLLPIFTGGKIMELDSYTRLRERFQSPSMWSVFSRRKFDRG